MQSTITANDSYIEFTLKDKKYCYKRKNSEFNVLFFLILSILKNIIGYKPERG